MIDYIALSIGHGVLAIAFLRLVMRDGLDVDPLLDGFKQAALERRKARSKAGRAKRAQAPGNAPPDPDAQAEG